VRNGSMVDVVVCCWPFLTQTSLGLLSVSLENPNINLIIESCDGEEEEENEGRKKRARSLCVCCCICVCVCACVCAKRHVPPSHRDRLSLGSSSNTSSSLRSHHPRTGHLRVCVWYTISNSRLCPARNLIRNLVTPD
jgi:hypothetical protein